MNTLFTHNMFSIPKDKHLSKITIIISNIILFWVSYYIYTSYNTI